MISDNGPEFPTHTTAAGPQPSERASMSHPVIDLIRRHSDKLKAIKPKNNTSLMYDEYSWLAKELVNLEPFSLESGDILEIWQSKDFQDAFGDPPEALFHSKYRRYAFVRILSLAYAIKGLPKEWEILPSWNFTEEQLPSEVAADTESINTVKTNLSRVITNYQTAADNLLTSTMVNMASDIRDCFGNALSVPQITLDYASKPLP